MWQNADLHETELATIGLHISAAASATKNSLCPPIAQKILGQAGHCGIASAHRYCALLIVQPSLEFGNLHPGDELGRLALPDGPLPLGPAALSGRRHSDGHAMKRLGIGQMAMQKRL